MWKPLIIGAVLGAAAGWLMASGTAAGGPVDRVLKYAGVKRG
jgi:hypothetical protein